MCRFMFIEQPPALYRLLFPKACWRLPLSKATGEKGAYLTFDDGPTPEVTPWLLDHLRKYQVKATFFLVGNNVLRYPELFHRILEEGHSVGNHTFCHLQGLYTSTKRYLQDTLEADHLIQSPLFRPPHGHMRCLQYYILSSKFKMIMWDVVTRDYSRIRTPIQVLNTVKRYTRDGSIIVFHDSLKAWKNMSFALPRAIEWLKEEGYQLKTITEGLEMSTRTTSSIM